MRWLLHVESEGGQEIGGSRAGMVLRDFGRFGLFVLNDGVIDGRRVLPEGWVEAAATPAFKVPAPSVIDITHYGYSWWLGDGVMSALGHSGQRIDIYRKEDLVVVTWGFRSPHMRHRATTTGATSGGPYRAVRPLSPERQESQGAGCCKVRRAIRRTAT